MPIDIVLDARPDRLDLRDREYRPLLRSLPASFPSENLAWAEVADLFNCYAENDLILDQGSEGACAGFGLAATINYLIWRDAIQDIKTANEVVSYCVDVRDKRVSERMLYQMARIYDEWDGEDYSGSSCRGAMKGWHRHGVCRKSVWPYVDSNGGYSRPEDGWELDALKNPLGAYYRVNHKSIVDIQSALVEVGALYCSASIHEGWVVKDQREISILQYSDSYPSTGGHAFCLVGYNESGFIVQNSWGIRWGWKGFAIISYPDWIKNGYDSWVVARGVPIRLNNAPQMFSNRSLHELSNSRALGWNFFKESPKYEYDDDAKGKPWSETRAYSHSLVLSNNGRPKHTVLYVQGPDETAREICFENLKVWLDKKPSNKKVVIYAHGGLNDEEAAIKRVQVMAPYFYENDIYPLFVVWKTGLTEILGDIVSDAYRRIIPGGRSEGFGEWVTDRADTAIEAVVRGFQVKSIWSEMKENAKRASDRAVPGFSQTRAGKQGGMVILARSLAELKNLYPELEIHLVGHSAGAILLGEWFKELDESKLKIESATLYAPACTIGFANKTFKKAIKSGMFDIKKFYIFNMDDEMEMADNTVKVYRKSLLYLVSRALEEVHKMPLLGLDSAWDVNNCYNKKSGGFHDSQKGEIERWAKFIAGGNKPNLYGREKSQVKTNNKPEYIKLSHGSFDNNMEIINQTIVQIRGSELEVKVVNLTGY